MNRIRVSVTVIMLTIVGGIFSCKKDIQQLNKDGAPSGVEGVWDGTITAGASTFYVTGVFSSSSVLMYLSPQLPVDTTKLPTYTGTYSVAGDSIHCTLNTASGGFTLKNSGNWYPAVNHNGVQSPAMISMSYPTLDANIYGSWLLFKE